MALSVPLNIYIGSKKAHPPGNVGSTSQSDGHNQLFFKKDIYLGGINGHLAVYKLSKKEKNSCPWNILHSVNYLEKGNILLMMQPMQPQLKLVFSGKKQKMFSQIILHEGNNTTCFCCLFYALHKKCIKSYVISRKF